jgi:hypothetical protein
MYPEEKSKQMSCSAIFVAETLSELIAVKSFTSRVVLTRVKEK